MNILRLTTACAAMLMAAGMAAAQPASGPGAGPGASAPRGPGGPGHMSGGRWGSGVTPGWSLMTPQERQQHRDKMRSMTSHDECKAYVDQHHQEMAARAKEKGLDAPRQPRRHACAGLQR